MDIFYHKDGSSVTFNGSRFFSNSKIPSKWGVSKDKEP